MAEQGDNSSPALELHQHYQDSTEKNSKLYNLLTHEKIAKDLKQKCIEKDFYIRQLEEMLQEHGLQLPAIVNSLSSAAVSPTLRASLGQIVLDSGGIEEIINLIQEQKKLVRNFNFAVEFYDLTLTTKVNKQREIASISTILSSLFCFWQRKEKEEIEILAHATGRIAPAKMTLLIGPPGSGKSGNQNQSA